MKRSINIRNLNTGREVELCHALGYIIHVNGTIVQSIAELFLTYNRMKEELYTCKDVYKERRIIETLNEFSAFFYRWHISEEGNKEQQNEIRELKIPDDYWTYI